jgi:hypothetical protein
MKALYFSIGIVQVLTISASAVLRRQAWDELDFPGGQPEMAGLLTLSGVLLLLWLVCVLLAAVLAAYGKPNRAVIVLVLVTLFPFVEFLGWVAYSF